MENKTFRFASGEAKSHFHEILDLVGKDGAEVIITRHGREIVRLIPAEPVKPRPKLLGFLKQALEYPEGADLKVTAKDLGKLRGPNGEEIDL